MRRAAVGLLGVLLFAGCDEKKTTAAKPVSSASEPVAALAPSDEAKSIFANRCAMCHGAGGRGDGPSAATLNPKPRDFTSHDWQKSVTDAQLASAIVKGGPAVGKSPLMPPNPDLEQKPAVVDALVAQVRSLGH